MKRIKNHISSKIFIFSFIITIILFILCIELNKDANIQFIAYLYVLEKITTIGISITVIGLFNTFLNFNNEKKLFYNDIIEKMKEINFNIKEIHPVLDEFALNDLFLYDKEYIQQYYTKNKMNFIHSKNIQDYNKKIKNNYEQSKNIDSYKENKINEVIYFYTYFLNNILPKYSDIIYKIDSMNAFAFSNGINELNLFNKFKGNRKEISDIIYLYNDLSTTLKNKINEIDGVNIYTDTKKFYELEKIIFKSKIAPTDFFKLKKEWNEEQQIVTYYEKYVHDLQHTLFPKFHNKIKLKNVFIYKNKKIMSEIKKGFIEIDDRKEYEELINDLIERYDKYNELYKYCVFKNNIYNVKNFLNSAKIKKYNISIFYNYIKREYYILVKSPNFKNLKFNKFVIFTDVDYLVRKWYN